MKGETMNCTIFQQIKAENDRNGNPQRLTVAYSIQTGEIVAGYDQGYRGDLIPKDHVEIPAVKVTRAEYRSLKYWMAAQGLLG
jgi:hypothetical protein